MNYKKQVFLNPKKSSSTGNVVAFRGKIKDKEGSETFTFLSISDCYASVRLHKRDEDSDKEFIKKMKLLRNTIDDFICHLESCL